MLPIKNYNFFTKMLEMFRIQCPKGFESWLCENEEKNPEHFRTRLYMFNEISLDAPLCPVWRIILYTSENVQIDHIYIN